MSKTLWFILILILVVLIEIGVLGRFFSYFNLSILIPLVLVISLTFSLEESLSLSLMSGLLLDISTLQRLPFWSLFLVAQVLLIHAFQKKLIDFSGKLSMILVLVLIIILRLVIQFIIYSQEILSSNLLYSLLGNLILSLIIMFLWFWGQQKWKVLRNEKGYKKF